MILFLFLGLLLHFNLSNASVPKEWKKYQVKHYPDNDGGKFSKLPDRYDIEKDPIHVDELISSPKLITKGKEDLKKYLKKIDPYYQEYRKLSVKQLCQMQLKNTINPFGILSLERVPVLASLINPDLPNLKFHFERVIELIRCTHRDINYLVLAASYRNYRNYFKKYPKGTPTLKFDRAETYQIARRLIIEKFFNQKYYLDYFHQGLLNSPGEEILAIIPLKKDLLAKYQKNLFDYQESLGHLIAITKFELKWAKAMHFKRKFHPKKEFPNGIWTRKQIRSKKEKVLKWAKENKIEKIISFTKKNPNFLGQVLFSFTMMIAENEKGQLESKFMEHVKEFLTNTGT